MSDIVEEGKYKYLNFVLKSSTWVNVLSYILRACSLMWQNPPLILNETCSGHFKVLLCIPPSVLFKLLDL